MDSTRVGLACSAGPPSRRVGLSIQFTNFCVRQHRVCPAQVLFFSCAHTMMSDLGSPEQVAPKRMPRRQIPQPAAVIPMPKRMPRPLNNDSWLSRRQRAQISVAIRNERIRVLRSGLNPQLTRIYLRAIRVHMLMTLRQQLRQATSHIHDRQSLTQ